jgi:divalent metal cation (Fe/Co/Zn/Cd) transporter
MKNEINKLLRTALILAVFTIVYNLAEGLISVFYGAEDETLALLGFGIDSFVEVISGIGILHMVIRMQRTDQNDIKMRDKFEKQALRITGTSFYILSIGLVIGSVLNIFIQKKPEETLAGILISIISILVMFVLMKLKLKTGRWLNSEAIIADANCTKTCFYLSFILLASSGLYEIFGFFWFDIAGSLGIAWFAFSEGKEAFKKASHDHIECNC